MSIRVFLADDHAMMRDGLRALLESEGGFQVVGEAADGPSTVTLVKSLRPDVVLMDIAMPLLNGIEVTRQIREACPSVRVLILSMHGSEEHVFRALRAGAHGFLLKESAGRLVAEALRTVHGGRLYLDDAFPFEFLLQAGGVNRDARSPLERLSDRERQVLQLVVEGHPSSEIADRLCLSVKTVETYRVRLMRKLGFANLPELVKFAVQQGLTPPR